MAAYTTYFNGACTDYPSATQFLHSGRGSGAESLMPTPTAGRPMATSAQSPNLLSPNMNSNNNNNNNDNNGAVTPDPASQTSTIGGSSVTTGSSTENMTVPVTVELNLKTPDSTRPIPCCDNARLTVSGPTMCSCQYDATRQIMLGSYTRSMGVGVGVYTASYATNEPNPYASLPVDSASSAPFYSALSNPYGRKDNKNSSEVTSWTAANIQPTVGYYSYDPTFGAYGYGATYDLAARRKNATRESTATLKAWLNEHKKNPYPTKGEKIMLAIITKMTLTQVSTWFANARRRLKKENKMTWEPKSRSEQEELEASDSRQQSPLDEERDGAKNHMTSDNNFSVGVQAKVPLYQFSTQTLPTAYQQHHQHQHQHQHQQQQQHGTTNQSYAGQLAYNASHQYFPAASSALTALSQHVNDSIAIHQQNLH